MCALLIGGLFGAAPLSGQVDLEFVTEWPIEVASAWVATREPSGEMYITLDSGHRVAMYGAGGEFLGEFGDQGSAPGQFLDPRGIAATSTGLIYVADSGNNRIQVIHRRMP